MKYFISSTLILISAVSQAQTTQNGSIGAKAAAAPISVNSGAGMTANFSSIVLSGQATRGDDGEVTFIVKNSCFGTNLRHVTNPLSPLATVRLTMGIRGTDGSVKNYEIQYPASTVTSLGVGQVMELNDMIPSTGVSENVGGTAVGNVVRFKTPLTTKVNVGKDGKLSFTRNGTIVSLNFEQLFVEVQAVDQPSFPLFSARSSKLCPNCTTTSGAQDYLKRALPFKTYTQGENWFKDYPLITAPVTSHREYNLAYQKWYNWYQEQFQIWLNKDKTYAEPYMGNPGQVSAHINLNQSRDGKQVEVLASFPGQEGYCAGYHSPLMVFFDDKRPRFSGQSVFPLHLGKTTWPEKGAPGYFVAYDRLGDGVITRKDELFGNSDEFKNGFEALRVFDTNKDDVIDEKDKEFKKLLLWQDKNGDGFSTPGELSPLPKRIKSISLKYDDKTVMAFSNRAEMKGRSTFVFTEKGKDNTGEILDIWFTPAYGK